MRTTQTAVRVCALKNFFKKLTGQHALTRPTNTKDQRGQVGVRAIVRANPNSGLSLSLCFYQGKQLAPEFQTTHRAICALAVPVLDHQRQPSAMCLVPVAKHASYPSEFREFGLCFKAQCMASGHIFSAFLLNRRNIDKPREPVWVERAVGEPPC